jgi:hypothetical protein
LGDAWPIRSPARDGDARQARARISHDVRAGLRVPANQLPCTDCGHVWALGDPRHDYDHHLGYGAEHHESVEAVCRVCHKRRTDERVARLNFVRGWLACQQAMTIAASWERWVNRESTDDDLTDAF